MARRRPATDLLKMGASDFEIQPTDPPVSKGMGFLATQSGERLEMMTRTNKPIILGISAGSAYCARYESKYIRDKTERIMRLAISSGGEGRKEMIQMVSAGGQVSDAFYNSGSSAPTDYPVGEDE